MSDPKYINESLILDPRDLEVAAVIIARICESINPQIDAFEASEIILEFLERKSLDIFNVLELTAIIRSECIFNPLRHTTH